MGAGAIAGAAGGALAGGGDPIQQLADTQNKALERSAQMNAMTAEFQSQMEALKAVSEALNAGHEANMQTLDKVGRAAG